MKQKVEESFDSLTKQYRRRYSLDNQRLCFLSVYLTEQKELESISFDVEAADDYHYQVGANQFPKLCKTLSCPCTEADMAAAFAERLKTWKEGSGLLGIGEGSKLTTEKFFEYQSEDKEIENRAYASGFDKDSLFF
jgi:hypothetical protein